MMNSATFYLDPAVEHDDIASLQRHLDVGPFDYVDVATQEAHAVALDRWPLLAEVDAWQKNRERSSS